MVRTQHKTGFPRNPTLRFPPNREPPLIAYKGSLPFIASRGLWGGGKTRNRTGDTLIFSQLLYQLSYLAVSERG